MPAWLADLSREVDPVYYPGDQLDKVAEPSQRIDLEPDAYAPVQEGRAVLAIKIDEFGNVDDVSVAQADPPTLLLYKEMATFRAARFLPAVRNGRVVKSSKLIEICFGRCGVPMTQGYDGVAKQPVDRPYEAEQLR
jgi:protein TonB